MTPTTVLLWHELPDGRGHHDWLLDPAGLPATLAGQVAADRLLAFRLTDRLDRLDGDATLAAERIADHRRRYLTYEGPISGGRGCVRRIAWGAVEPVGDDLRLTWTGGATGAGNAVHQTVRLVPGPASWIVRVSTGAVC